MTEAIGYADCKIKCKICRILPLANFMELFNDALVKSLENKAKESARENAKTSQRERERERMNKLRISK